jgi:hypothetical protein
MPNKAALVTVHGMGKTESNYATEFIGEIKKRLGSKSDGVYFGSIYYQNILQVNEDRVWNLVGGELGWKALRQFLLFGFADAAGLESNKEEDNSVYTQAQIATAKELFAARLGLGGNGPLVIIAQSLGGQVLSNYLWDAQHYKAPPDQTPVKFGVWLDPTKYAQAIANKNVLTPEEIAFLRGDSIRAVYTTGCNIPIFVAAHAVDQIIPINKPSGQFEWHNFYDKDDVLGWPLAQLSTKYAEIVKDHKINVSGGFLGWLFKSWNPLSHEQYWEDNDVLEPLVKLLEPLVS